MAEQHNRRHGDWRETVAGGALKSVEETLKGAAESAPRHPRRIARVILKNAPGLPGAIYDAASIAKADNWKREAAGVLGAGLGTLAGGGLGALAGGVNAPVGAVLGSAAGEELGKDLYDDHQALIDRSLEPIEDWVTENLLKQKATAAWMDQRNTAKRRR